MTRRSPRPSAEVRQLVVQAATTLFAERGYARVATRDIARYADVTPSQLFAHFGTKARLFEIAVVGPYVQTVLGIAERWREDPDAGGSPRPSNPELLRELLRELFDVLDTEPGLMTALIIAQAHEESLVEEIAPSLKPVDDALRPLEQLVRTPVSSDPQAPVLAIRLTHGIVMAATQFRPWLAGHLGDRESVIGAMTDLVANGLGEATGDEPGPLPRDRRPNEATTPREGMRGRLLDAAAELFEQHGYPGVSTRSIAAGAGTSETVLFRHFPTKTVLFEEAVSRPWADAVDDFLSHTADHGLAPLIAELFHLFHGHRPTLLALLEYERHSSEPTGTPATIAALLDHVERRLPADRPLRPSTAGLIVAGVLGAAVLDVWLFTGHAPGEDLVVAGLLDLVRSGITTY